jgi:hypothetical protein
MKMAVGAGGPKADATLESIPWKYLACERKKNR